MARGGVREGAGRKPGVSNKVTAAKRAEIAASGEEPLDYMLRIMRDEGAEERRRDKMAVDAAPYLHSKLATVDVNAQHDGKLIVEIVRFSGVKD